MAKPKGRDNNSKSISIISIISMVIVLLTYYLFNRGANLFLNELFSRLFNFGIKLPMIIWNVGLNPFYQIILFGLILVLFNFVEKKKYSETGFVGFKKEHFKLALFVLGILIPIAAISRIVDPTFDAWYGQLEPRFWTMAGVLTFIPVIFFSVIKEEILERSLIQSRLKSYGPMLAALLTCINFGFAHIFYYPGLFSQPVVMFHLAIIYITVFLGSLMIALLYESTRNIWLTMIVHLLYNWIFIFQTYWHLTNIKFELIFWTFGSILFLFVIFKLKDERKRLFMFFVDWKIPKLVVVDYLFIIIFALGLPIYLICLNAGII